MPKRGAIALLLTTGALALLLSFKTPSEVPVAAGDVAVAAVPSPTPAVVEAPMATAAPIATDPPATTETPFATDPPVTDAPATAAPSAAYRDGTVTGAAVVTRWGVVQLQVTISGGAIADVKALQLPSDDRHSAEISSRAEPILRSAALEAQSADITILSGATYTSLAYARSLQSALDEARS